MDENEQVNEKIVLEIARKLASEGNYEEAIQLLSPLIHSEFSIESLNLLGKIYAQKQDFESASVYFRHVLEQDKNNVEAINGLNKCDELRDSKIKTYFNFNKLKVYSIIVAAILLVGIIALAAFSLSGTSNSSQFEGTVLADADILSLSIHVYGDTQYVLDTLNYIDSNVANIDINQSDNVINVTGDVNAIYSVLSELENYDAHVDSISLLLSDESKNNLSSEAYNVAVNSAKINSTNIKEIKNISTSVVPNTFYFDNDGVISTQEQSIYSMLNENNMKVKVISVIEVIS